MSAASFGAIRAGGLAVVTGGASGIGLAAAKIGDFYILCPDNETTPEQDRKRIAWAAGDLIENRPTLSRWHPDWKGAFERHMAD